MKTIAGGLVLALLLVAAGAAFWSQARFAGRVGEAHRRLATLQYDGDVALDSTSDAWNQGRWQTTLLGEDIQQHRATVTYWLGRYKALTPMIDLTGNQAVKDSNVLLAAANASYRTSTPEQNERKVAVERLDKVMQAYADVMRLDPSLTDASYNYEYVARVRDLIAKGKKPAHPPVNRADAIKGDLPIGPTVHGLPGFPPAEVDMGDFKTLTPMKYEEREEQTDPGRGTFQRRKG